MRFAQQAVVASETISLSPRQTISGLGSNDGLVGIRYIQTTGGMHVPKLVENKIVDHMFSMN